MTPLLSRKSNTWACNLSIIDLKEGLDHRGTATKLALITPFFVTVIEQGILPKIDGQVGYLLLDSFGLVLSSKIQCPQTEAQQQ